MSYQNRTRPVHPPAPLRVETRSSSSSELLIGLFATGTPRDSRQASWAPASIAQCPAPVRAPLRAIGARAGEIWLHLLGLALDVPGEAAGFADLIEATDAIEIRRYLVGEHVPAWRAIVGADTLAAAAEGDHAAGDALLRDRRYYGGRARESLKTLLPLSADETRARLAAAVRAFETEVFAPVEAVTMRTLAEAAATANELAASLPPEALIDRLAGGYRYEREAGLDNVVLIPHTAAQPWLLLCQHRASRVICHPVSTEEPAGERLLQLGRALGDEGRIAILARLRRGPATLQELADEVGLAKSTVHHHAALLRAARLIALQGNASRYVYVLEDDGVATAQRLLEELRSPTSM